MSAPDAIRPAKADQLEQIVARSRWASWLRTDPPAGTPGRRWRHPEGGYLMARGELGLDARAYDELRGLGLTRAEVHRAADDLVDASRATVESEAGMVVIRLAEGAS